MTLQGGDGNPPSAPTSEVQAKIKAITDDTEQAASKRQRTNTDPDPDPIGPISNPEPIMSSDPNSATGTKETNTQEPNLYDFNFDFELTPSHPKSSSGVRFEARSSSGAGVTEHDEAAFRSATEKRKIIEQSNSDSDDDANVARLRRRVVVLEQYAALKDAQFSSLQQDSALKEAHISSLQAQISSRDQTIDQLQGYLGMLMSIVDDLKAKLEKKFGKSLLIKKMNSLMSVV
ncbi:hypothetical protein Hanom_Chr12g01132061 [Helianthus anomalus]